jgi:ATP synthase F1 epsilon subunit
MANTLKLEIVTPEARIYSEDVDMVTLPAVEGEMGIFPQHIALMTQVVHGEIIARKGSQEHCLAVGEGFVEITGGLRAGEKVVADGLNRIQDGQPVKVGGGRRPGGGAPARKAG